MYRFPSTAPRTPRAVLVWCAAAVGAGVAIALVVVVAVVIAVPLALL